MNRKSLLHRSIQVKWARAQKRGDHEMMPKRGEEQGMAQQQRQQPQHRQGAPNSSSSSGMARLPPPPVARLPPPPVRTESGELLEPGLLALVRGIEILLRIAERVSPRVFRVVALPAPS